MDAPLQLRPPAVSLLGARRVLGLRVVLFEPRLAVEPRLQKAGKAGLELRSFRIELSLRVWISLGPGVRAFPPSASDFPAAAELGFWSRPA